MFQLLICLNIAVVAGVFESSAPSKTAGSPLNNHTVFLLLANTFSRALKAAD
jgi:hypothetical protein